MWLTVVSGPDAGSSSEVTGKEVTIGRGEDCDIVLADRQASRVHARIRPLGDGRYELSDLGSSNGTYLDGLRVDQPTVLDGTQQIQVGETVFAAAAGEDPGGRGATMAGARRASRIGRRGSAGYSALPRALARPHR